MSDDFDDELLALAGGDEEIDIEEGEASSVAASSPNSLGSGDMDESDSDRDDEPPARDSGVLYPLEGQFIDLRDKQRIMSMSQLEREEILGQRAEEISRTNFQAELQKRAAMNNKKRKADSEEPEDSRKSSRQVKPKRNAALDAYTAAREQKGQQRQRADDSRNDRRRSDSLGRDGGSDVDAEGEEDVDWDNERKPAVREDLPVTLRDVESIRIGRGFFSKVCFWPGFDEAMNGAFGRIGIGQDKGRTVYRMAQIKGFQAGKPYVFDGKDGQRIATDQYVICKHGSTQKEYPFQYLSNQRFTDADFDAYRHALSEAGTKLPTQSYVTRKIDEIKAFDNRFWTDDDINARIQKSNKYAHLLHRDRGEEAAPRIPTQSEAAANRLAELNRKNREAERERIRVLQLEERKEKMKARKRAEDDARRKKAEEEKRKAEEERKNLLSVDDLFDGGSSRASSVAKEETPKPEGEAKKKEKSERKGLPTFRKPKMDDDIIASMDIGLDIEI
ncbi:plus-3-domain-containing protein [Paraphaeosphaeria sporulosa]|uniref:Plus-3-domain-containing protein n=1 Tax=Paraphaeosphaeria sporulosa TaxID=1460663 RepID=A0A177CXB9_9PLEO|nr:plus-3-domain-containing protein [Paraphaeosphaeria sporulosa]OAG12214.1 plus-3-domain-containing protein [Paraphaeosphaeria sporulosa]